ncbi:MAG: hypothetical protein AB7N24_23305 [Dehalococcoidia bacterium]
MRATKVLLLFVMLLPAYGRAGPDSTTNYLMSDSFTLLDWGIYRMQMTLDASKLFEIENTGVSRSVSYDWDRNRIVVEVLSLTESKEDEQFDAKALCNRLINAARVSLGVHPETGKPLLGGDHSFASGYFSHQGFKLKKQPEDLRAQIDKLIELRAIVYLNLKANRECNGPLLGTEIFTKN